MKRSGIRLLLLSGLMLITATVVSAQSSRVGNFGLEINLTSNPTGVDVLSTLNMAYHLPYFINNKVSIGPYVLTNWGINFEFFEGGALGKYYFREVKSEGVSDYAKLQLGFNNVGVEEVTAGVGYGIEYSFNKNIAVGTDLRLDITPSHVQLAPGISFRINH